MRSRNIKPGFFKNEYLADCSFGARLCFVGLWMLADREGRLEDRPKRIKGELFAFDSVEVEPLLQELSATKFIVRYEIGGHQYIKIPTFNDHQSPHYSEKASVIPEQNSRSQVPIKQGAHQDEAEKKLSSRGGRNPLNPDSLNPDSPPTPQGGGTVHKFPPGFEAFWQVYPKKVGKDAAARAFAKCKFDANMLALVQRAVEAQKISTAWLKDGGQFIPNPATWLNQGRWQDEADGAPHRGSLFEGNL